MTKEEFDHITESVIAQVVTTMDWATEEEKNDFIHSGARLFTAWYREDIPDDVVAAVRAACVTWVVISLTLQNLVTVLEEHGLANFIANMKVEGLSVANLHDNLNTAIGAAKTLLSHIER